MCVECVRVYKYCMECKCIIMMCTLAYKMYMIVFKLTYHYGLRCAIEVVHDPVRPLAKIAEVYIETLSLHPFDVP